MNTKILGLAVLVLGSTANTFAMESNAMFSANLGVGANGEFVTKLQNFLSTNGYLKATARGHFGPATRAALIKYQMENGISTTGFLGPLTRNKINNKMSMTNDNMMNGNVNMSAGVMVGGAAMLPSRDIVDNAVLANNVTTVVAAVKAAGLVDTLKSAGPFTVFAPTNAAFEKLPTGTVDTLLKVENKAKLTDILTYHVVAGRYTSADLKDGMMLKTVEGKEIKISIKDGKVFVNGSAMVETADVISSNGVTHVIDGVLIPASN